MTIHLLCTALDMRDGPGGTQYEVRRYESEAAASEDPGETMITVDDHDLAEEYLHDVTERPARHMPAYGELEARTNADGALYVLLQVN